MLDGSLNLATLSHLFVDENAARLFIESKVWPTGPVCPHCGSSEAYKLTAKPDSKRPVRDGVYKCKECRKQFTVRIGTIFEDSHIPFSKWLMALHLMTSSKKGISSLQISRELDITIKSAWFLTHRIREAMRNERGGKPLTGVVEADETYVGGKPRKVAKSKVILSRKDSKFKARPKTEYGRGTKKAPVVALVERGGGIVVQHMPSVSANNLREMMNKSIDKNETRLCTDELNVYKQLGREFGGGHGVVKHSADEYARGSDHVNTAESFFALLKRGMHGAFHHVSKVHLSRYCDEFAFRWDRRKVSDGERMVAAVVGAKGKRLVYHQASA